MISLWEWELKNKILEKHFLVDQLKIKKVYDLNSDKQAGNP
jgi:hypothetical protein